MSVLLLPAAEADKSAAALLLADYLAEMAALGAASAGADSYFDLYWSEEGRWPYLVSCAGSLAGLALVNRWSPSGRVTERCMAEFYVAPGFRGGGVGRKAAGLAFDRHPGQWEVAASKVNRVALAYWPSVLAAVGATDVQTLDTVDNRIWRFTARAAAAKAAGAQTP